MTETPESRTEPTAVAATERRPAESPARRPNRLNQIAAWVGIVAGVVFIVAAIFFSGFAIGKHSGGYFGRDHRGDEFGMYRDGGPRMGPGQMGPGGMMGPGQMGPGGMMGPGQTGPGQTGPGGMMGPGQTGPGQTGPGQTGPGGMMGPGQRQSPTPTPAVPSSPRP